MKNMPGHRFFAPHFDGDRVTLSPDESHHALHVVRLRVGDAVSVFDGRGREVSAVVSRLDRTSVELELGDDLAGGRESSLHLVLAAGLLKGEKFEWVIQKAVELGVSEIVPLITEHVGKSAVKQDGPARRLRWERIALEATKQCGRRILTPVRPPISFTEFLSAATGDAKKVMFVERDGRPWRDAVGVSPCATAIVLVGPEGGWSGDETVSARDTGFELVTLGPRILRAETAAIVAVTLAQTVFGDLG